jgi:hypothetical protein
MTETLKKAGKTEKPKLTREIITAIGKRLAEFDDVEDVIVRAEFKDGSGIRFAKEREC